MKAAPIILALLLLSSFRPKVKSTFPENWKGNWNGQCTLVKNGKNLLFTMKLHIKPELKDSIYQFHIQYDQQPVREYKLIKGRTPDEWLTDEQNSIVLKGYFHNGHLVEFFQVDSTLIRSDFHRHKNKMEVLMESYHLRDIKKTGLSLTENTFFTFPLLSRQYGTLTLK